MTDGTCADVRVHAVSSGGVACAIVSVDGKPVRIRRTDAPATIMWERGDRMIPGVAQLIEAASLAAI